MRAKSLRLPCLKYLSIMFASALLAVSAVSASYAGASAGGSSSGPITVEIEWTEDNKIWTPATNDGACPKGYKVEITHCSFNGEGSTVLNNNAQITGVKGKKGCKCTVVYQYVPL